MTKVQLAIYFGKKKVKFGKVFGYWFMIPEFVFDGPEKKREEFEILLDKSIAEKKDYLADYLGYDIEEKKRQVEEQRKNPVFYD